MNFQQITQYQLLKQEFIDVMLDNPNLAHVAIYGSLQESSYALKILSYRMMNNKKEEGKDMYTIYRFYFRGGKRTIKGGLTLEEAQSHCKDPQTSSRTCTSSVGKRRTKRMGPWFDGIIKVG